ncbi:MAG TPA: tetratricopeptide repeat protein [Candidatus Udaeobacter sp.]
MKINPDDLPPPKEPYRGILPFRLLDWRIFLERDEEAERLGNLVSMYSGVLLYGQSGAGKSSLVNAGLIPHALRQGRAPERIRVFPKRGHELLVERIQLEEDEEHSEKELPRYLPSRFTSSDDDERVALSCEQFLEALHKSSKPDSDLGVPLLIFDQFEELVTLFEESPNDKERFEEAREARSSIDRMLCELLLNDPLPFKIVFAFRDDYLARLAPLFSRIPNLMDQGVRLASLPVAVVKEIVRGPFVSSPDGERGLPGHFGDELSEELADKITAGIQASKPSGVLNLSELQTLCLALWRQPERREELLRADKPAAVLQQIIESTAVAALKKLRPWDRVRALALLANLVTQEGTRNVVSEENLISETRRNPLMWVFPRGWRKLLNNLPEKTGLLRRSISSGTTYYELASEFLISWIQKRQRAFRGITLTVWRLASAALLAIAVGLIFLNFRLKDEKDKAVAAQKMAVEQERAARSGALRVRKQNLDDKSTMLNMAERLIELTSPEEAAIWLEFQAGAWGDLRKHEEAIQVYERVIELEPQDAGARWALGYHYLVIGKADKALEQTDAALERDPTNWILYQNRGIALAALGRYEEATASIRKSIDMFQHAGTEPSESDISPDIQQATGRTALLMGERAVRAATVCELANLEAFAGGDEFTTRLSEASRKAQPVETYLTAVDWAWLHLKARPQDYGAFAAQGAWWEQAGFGPWAKRAYEQFQSKYNESQEPRYAKLAGWVSERLKELKDERLPKEQPDAETLAFDAWDHEQRKEMDAAQYCLDRVIKMEPDNGTFLLLRAWFLERRAEACVNQRDWAGAEKFYKASKVDCDALLKMDQRCSSAYQCRALASQGLDAPKAEIEADFRKAVEHNHSDVRTMMQLSDLIKKERPDEALRLLDQALRVNTDYASLPWIHSRMATIFETKGQLQDALRSIETAIASKDDEGFLYDIRARIEHKLSKPDSEINQHLAAGYRLVGDTEAKQAKRSDAFKAYWRSLEATAGLNPSITAAQDQEELATLEVRISATIERLGSREKAAEFWRLVNESNRFPALKQSVTAELSRLTTPAR